MNSYLHLLIVYLVWGSTFVAMRAAVIGHSGFQPFSVAASRLAVASVLLFGWAWFRKMDLRLKRRDLMVCAVSGALIWLCGNAFVMWAEQWIDAGYATLVFSTLPIWTILVGCILDRKYPSAAVFLAAFAALGGMMLLGGLDLFSGNNQILIPTLTVLLSAILWSISTHLQRRMPLSCAPMVASAYQQLFGGICVFVAAQLAGESMPHPSAQAWIAWGYLVIFGSIIAYSSYVHVVQHFSPSISMTFAYVCPVLTVIFGHFVLKEPLDAHKILGMVVILSSVLCIFYDQQMRNKAARRVGR